MSIKVMTDVWEHSTCKKSSSLLLLLALADHADDDGICWPSIARLAKKIRRGKRQTKRILAGLEATGEIYRMSGVGRSNTNHYLVAAGRAEGELLAALTGRLELARDDARMVVDTIMTMRKSVANDTITETEKVTSRTIKSDTGDTNSERERVSSVTVKGDISDERVSSVTVKGDIAMSPESSENHHENRHESSHGRKAAAQAMFSALAEVCQIDWRMCTKKQRDILNQSEAILRNTDVIPADLEEFGEWWYAFDWRGKKGDVPRPAQVRDTWGQFTAWRDSGRRPARATHQQGSRIADKPPAAAVDPAQVERDRAAIAAHRAQQRS